MRVMGHREPSISGNPSHTLYFPFTFLRCNILLTTRSYRKHNSAPRLREPLTTAAKPTFDSTSLPFVTRVIVSTLVQRSSIFGVGSSTFGRNLLTGTSRGFDRNCGDTFPDVPMEEGCEGKLLIKLDIFPGFLLGIDKCKWPSGKFHVSHNFDRFTWRTTSDSREYQ